MTTSKAFQSGLRSDTDCCAWRWLFASWKDGFDLCWQGEPIQLIMRIQLYYKPWAWIGSRISGHFRNITWYCIVTTLITREEPSSS
jgi:hypothetical protein